jgi:hypothetical protein
MRFSYLFKQTTNRILYLIALDIVFLLLTIWSFLAENQLVYLRLFLSLIFLIPAAITIREIKYRFLKGEEGEDKVFRELKKLPPGFYFIHDFSKDKKGNVDFIVLSTTGIWTIEVKNESYSYINNAELISHDLGQAYAESKSIQTFILNTLHISIPVHAVLAYTNPKTKITFGLNTVKGVYVIGISWLVKLLTTPNNRVILNQEQLVKLKEELQKYTSFI